MNRLSGIELFMLSNGDFFFRSMPTASTKCVNLDDEVRAGCPKLGYTTLDMGGKSSTQAVPRSKKN